jgi:peroxiredoxin
LRSPLQRSLWSHSPSRTARLREELRTLRRRGERPYPGLVVPTFGAVSLAGDSVTIGEGAPGVRQVLFIFNTTCGFCRETLPYWSSIAAELRTEEPREVGAYGISVDSEAETRRYVREEGLSFPVVRFPEAKLVRLYRAEGVPRTLVLDHEGGVLYARAGSFGSQGVVDSIIAAARAPAASDSVASG